MQRGMMDSYKRTFKFIKENILTILIMCLVMFILTIGMTIAQQVATFLIYILSFVLVILIAIGIALIIEGGGIMVLGIILLMIGTLLALITLAFFIGFIVFIGSFGMGIQILISELLYKMKHEGKITWRESWSYINASWRILLKKGAKLFLSYLAVLIPFILLINILYGGVIGLLIYSVVMAPDSGPVITVVLLVILFISTIFAIGLIVLIPILWFVVDSSTVRIAEGNTVKKAFRHGFKDIRYSRRGVWYYIAGVFILAFTSLIIFPLAFILQPLIPILTKAFIMSNRDMFYE